MTHEPFDTLAPVYAAGALDGDDLVRFEAHLRDGCSDCETVVRESTAALTAAARGLPAAIAPAEVRAKLLRRVAASPRPRPARARFVPWAVATAAAVVATAAFTAGVVASRYEARIGIIAREAAALRERVRKEEAALRDEITAARAVAELLRDPATRVVALRGLAAAPSASGRVVWNDRGGGRLYVTGLPPAPAGKTYELWTIAGTTPRPAGIFDVDAAGAAARAVAPAADAAAPIFAVTVEPAGGVPAPTGPMVLASSR